MSAWGHARRMEHVFEELAEGAEIDDAHFDRIFPEWYRARSRLHWTPIPVIRRAVSLLTESRPEACILDAGSGAGKFCLVGSMLAPQARFTGVEQRPHFVQLSEDITRHYHLHRLRRLTWTHENLENVDWRRFDGVYLFNPFQEHKTQFQRIDASIPLDEKTYRSYIAMTQAKLASMAKGTRVVTYHGYGGPLPRGYGKIIEEFCYRGPLEYWIKEEDPSTGSAWSPQR